jgi:uncharacterized protein YegP (UPF0339 family)
VATFIINKDKAGEWRWKLLAGNNQVIADSAEGYKRREDCIAGIRLVKRDAPAADVYDASEDPKKRVDGV